MKHLLDFWKIAFFIFLISGDVSFGNFKKIVLTLGENIRFKISLKNWAFKNNRIDAISNVETGSEPATPLRSPFYSCNRYYDLTKNFLKKSKDKKPYLNFFDRCVRIVDKNNEKHI